MGDGTGTHPLLDGADSEMLDGAFEEAASAFEEPITLRRWKGTFNEATVDGGLVRQPQFDDVTMTAVIQALGTSAISVAAGVYAAGDLSYQIRIRPTEPGATTGHPGDRLVYEGVEYLPVQKSVPQYIGRQLFWTGVMRRRTEP